VAQVGCRLAVTEECLQDIKVQTTYDRSGAIIYDCYFSACAKPKYPEFRTIRLLAQSKKRRAIDVLFQKILTNIPNKDQIEVLAYSLKNESSYKKHHKTINDYINYFIGGDEERLKEVGRELRERILRS
jgi:hypothetical protein